MTATDTECFNQRQSIFICILISSLFNRFHFSSVNTKQEFVMKYIYIVNKKTQRFDRLGLFLHLIHIDKIFFLNVHINCTAEPRKILNDIIFIQIFNKNRTRDSI